MIQMIMNLMRKSDKSAFVEASKMIDCFADSFFDFIRMWDEE